MRCVGGVWEVCECGVSAVCGRCVSAVCVRCVSAVCVCVCVWMGRVVWYQGSVYTGVGVHFCVLELGVC